MRCQEYQTWCSFRFQVSKNSHAEGKYQAQVLALQRYVDYDSNIKRAINGFMNRP